MNMRPTVTKKCGLSVTVASPNCAKCKRVMAPKIYPGMPKRFCSTACRMKAHRLAKKLMRRNEFYTPSHIIELVRACMGGIDLDPASCAIANETVKASTYYGTRQNGLKRPWFGRVWLNPPYGRFGPAFVRRAVDEFKLGRIEQVIIELSVNHIANGWFSDAMQVEHAICLMRNRIAHYSPVNSISSAKTGSVLIGLGVDRERFEEFFSPLGKIAFVAG